MATSPDLLDMLSDAIASADESLDEPGETTAARDPYASATSAGGWMVDHLAFTVPWCIADLDHRARAARPVADWGLSYADRVQHRLAQIGRELGATAGGREPQRSLPALIGAMGDSLLGESKPGQAAAVGMAMAWGLAGVALLCDDGATFRGLHWCHPGGCSCTPSDEVGQVPA